jgi:hypothetical protein
MPERRRFPPPWSIEESAACFIVRDGNRQALAYVYYETEAGRRSSANLLTRDEAHLTRTDARPRPQSARKKRQALQISRMPAKRV